MTGDQSGDELPRISVVLPAHNEEGNIEAVVRDAVRVLPSLTAGFEILVVDDGSIDSTGRIADALGAEIPAVKPIHHPKNRGYGCAWRTGIEAARFEWIFFMDSDRQFDIADITRLLPGLDGHDIVAGYRIKRRDPFYRFAVGSCFNILVTALFRVHLRDIDCGFKIFRASLLKSMELEMPGALINTEIHAKANLAGARMLEVGINHHPRTVGRQSGTKPSVVLRAGWEIVALKLRLMRQGHKGATERPEARPATEANPPPR